MLLALTAVSSKLVKDTVVLTNDDVVKFFQGAISGISSMEFPDLTVCLKDVTSFGPSIVGSVTDFELNSFDGTKNALE